MSPERQTLTSCSRSLWKYITNRYTQLIRIVCGDRLGLIILLTALVVTMGYWRIGFVINDNFGIANTLVAVSEGHLDAREAVYGRSLDVPGMHLVDGRVYGRNYGIIFIALLFLWGLELLSTVAELRIALIAGWCLLLLALIKQIGRHFHTERIVTYAGSVLVLVLFVLNVAVATPIEPAQLPIIALQLPTLLATALTGVIMYRLLAQEYSQRIGVFAGLATTLATPVGFWASIPKRHAFVILLVVTAMWCLYRSREHEGTQYYRAGAYACVGLLAWITVPEALILLLPLLLVDAPTWMHDRRTLIVVGGVLGISLVPMLLTNTLISGNPLRAPFFLPGYSAQALEAAQASTNQAASSGTSTVTDAPEKSTTSTITGSIVPLWERVWRAVQRAVTAFVGGDPWLGERLVQTFVRGGYIHEVAKKDGGRAINLTVVESAPLVGILGVLPVLAVKRVRTHSWTISTLRNPSPRQALDLFAIAYAIVLTGIMLPRLPIHAQITVRYLLALFPLGIYGVCRLQAVRHLVETQSGIVALSWCATTFIGGQLLVLWVLVASLTDGEAVQLHALLGLVGAVVMGSWLLVQQVHRGDDRLGAGLLGVVLGLGTAFLFVSAFLYFPYGEFALPGTQKIAAALAAR